MADERSTLHDFITDPVRRGKRATIGAYVFYLNPDSIDGETARQHIEYVTTQGGGSFRYPTKPEVWTLSGHTGIKGADELERMYGRLAPQNKPEVLLPFTFPPLFLGTLYVLINDFKRGMSNDRHLYCQFTLEMLVLPKPRQASYQRVANTVQVTGTAAPQPTTENPFGLSGP